MSYTIVKRAHACEKPGPEAKLAFGSVIRCDECQTEWELTWLGWVKRDKS